MHSDQQPQTRRRLAKFRREGKPACKSSTHVVASASRPRRGNRQRFLEHQFALSSPRSIINRCQCNLAPLVALIQERELQKYGNGCGCEFDPKLDLRGG